jgi:hypothetical protein
VEFGKNAPIVPCPLKPEVTLHWLAVNGSQPQTADNPSVVAPDANDQPMLLSKELQVPSNSRDSIVCRNNTGVVFCTAESVRENSGHRSFRLRQ